MSYKLREMAIMIDLSFFETNHQMFLLPRQRVKDQIARDRAERAEKVRLSNWKFRTLNGSADRSRMNVGSTFMGGSKRGG